MLVDKHVLLTRCPLLQWVVSARWVNSSPSDLEVVLLTSVSRVFLIAYGSRTDVRFFFWLRKAWFECAETGFPAIHFHAELIQSSSPHFLQWLAVLRTQTFDRHHWCGLIKIILSNNIKINTETIYNCNSNLISNQ